MIWNQWLLTSHQGYCASRLCPIDRMTSWRYLLSMWNAVISICDVSQFYPWTGREDTICHGSSFWQTLMRFDFMQEILIVVWELSVWVQEDSHCSSWLWLLNFVCSLDNGGQFYSWVLALWYGGQHTFYWHVFDLSICYLKVIWVCLILELLFPWIIHEGASGQEKHHLTR